ncbi:MAG: hypothetical protein V4547_13965 [Bacteroidota bacterium]
MNYKKIILALIILFNVGILEFALAQDSIARKFHFGIQGNMNLYYEHSQNSYLNGTYSTVNFGNGTLTSPNYTTVTYKNLFYQPSLDFFLQLNRCYLDIGLSNLSSGQNVIEAQNSGTIKSSKYKYFSIGFESRFIYLVMNPNKNFIAPYLELGLKNIYFKDTYNSSSPLEEIEKSKLFSGFFGTGIQKNFKKNIFVRLGVLGNFLAKGYGDKATKLADRQGEIVYGEISLGYSLR